MALSSVRLYQVYNEGSKQQNGVGAGVYNAETETKLSTCRNIGHKKNGEVVTVSYDV